MNANRIIVKDIARKSLNSFICYKVTKLVPTSPRYLSTPTRES